MSYLFIDSTHDITIGIWSKDDSWISYCTEIGQKGSQVVHTLIDEMLKKHKMVFGSLKGVIHASGPGSYTGMRLSEGIVQVLEWHNLESYSFYHFEVPLFLEMNDYIWQSDAFKGEIFTFDSKTQERKLTKKEEEPRPSVLDTYTHHETKMNTKDLIHKRADDLFNYVLDNKIRRDIYYYRKLEDEFKKQK